jgi:hypothetical protein
MIKNHYNTLLNHVNVLQVLEYETDSSIEVRFLRKVGNSWVFPEVDDISIEDIDICQPVNVIEERRNKYRIA